ncbi:MAG: hypothetical protein Q9M29_05725, partial [Mariprofundaceae bacterium]|nr:hypothetical protein [Mariprofundaceae bacterium]
RQILDQGGLQAVHIFVSGNLDEYRIQDLLEAGAPIDGFGVGTILDTSADVPYLDCAYKLQEYAGRPRRKRSEGKATWPGRKQVYRHYNGQGQIARDVLALENQPAAGGVPLLQPVMRDGRRCTPQPGLEEIRRHAAAQVSRLPAELRRLQGEGGIRVEVSAELQTLAAQMDRES